MKTIEKIIIAIGFAGIILMILMSNSTNKSTGSLTGGENIFSTVSSTSAMTLTTSSALITATSSTRQYVAIVNDCASAIYLNFNDKNAVGSSGLRLNGSGGSYEINSQNLYKGAIRGISPSGNCTITYVEK